MRIFTTPWLSCLCHQQKFPLHDAIVCDVAASRPMCTPKHESSYRLIHWSMPWALSSAYGRTRQAPALKQCEGNIFIQGVALSEGTHKINERRFPTRTSSGHCRSCMDARCRCQRQNCWAAVGSFQCASCQQCVLLWVSLCFPPCRRPWALLFSYGHALQASAFKAWGGSNFTAS